MALPSVALPPVLPPLLGASPVGSSVPPPVPLAVPLAVVGASPLLPSEVVTSPPVVSSSPVVSSPVVPGCSTAGNGPRTARVMPSPWMLTNMVFPSGEKQTPANSLSLAALRAKS